MEEKDSILKHYRTTGELSDFNVKLDEMSFELHKFPLCLRSDYIKNKLKEQPNLSSINLEDFPGGGENFGTIADFIYDEVIEIKPENAAKLLAGARYLIMTGKTNLINLCEVFIDKIIKDAKSYRRLEPFIKLLICSACLNNGDIEDLSKALLKTTTDSWLRHHGTCSHSPRRYGELESLEFCEDLDVLDYLIYVPDNLIITIIKDCKETPERHSYVGHLVANYLGRMMDLDKLMNRNFQKSNEELDKSSERLHDEIKDEENKSNTCEETVIAKILKQSLRTDYTRLDYGAQQEMENLINNFEYSLKKPIEVFNEIFESIDYDICLKRSVDHVWIRDALLLVQRENEIALCKPKILELSSEYTVRFRPEDLVDLEPETLLDVINKSKSDPNNENPRKATELSASVTETILYYMVEYSKSHDLSVQDYIRLLEVTQPKEKALYKDPDMIVTPLLRFADKGEKLDEETQNKILSLVDLKRCSPETLETLLGKELLPAKEIAQAAIYTAKQIHVSNSSDKYTSQYCAYQDRSETPSEVVRKRINSPISNDRIIAKTQQDQKASSFKYNSREEYSVPSYTPSFYGLGKKYSNKPNGCGYDYLVRNK